MEDYLKRLYARHKRGAWVRSGASLAMWFFALISFFQGIIQPYHFIGVTASVLLLVLMNPPTLWALKKTTNTGWYSFFSLLINVLEIIGYTAIIYFLGGIEALYLIPIYIILISYVGIVSSRRLPFIIAGICSLCLTGMLVLVHLGFLPQMNVISGFYIPWENQLTNLFVIVGFLFVSAFISSYIAAINRRNREKLREQNVKLQETADELLIEIERRKREIEDRKRAEEEKRSLEERLQRSEKMEALGQLAGGVAHDLNNVLGIVVGYAELGLMEVDESSSIKPHLVNIMKGGQRAAAIVDDLLTLARRGVSGRSILNLNKIIADCQQLPEFGQLSFHHPSVKVKTDLDPDLLNISGSSVHLGKSLFNLVSNACEAMSKGGIVTIKTANQYLDKPIQGYDNIRSGDYVVLSVSDTGEGISANDMKRIFEPFYTKKVMGRSGTGLGLAVVWGTVKDHSGYIDVWSEEGKGSIFILYFPITREEISAEAVAIAISKYMGKGESILVVDDVKEQCDLATKILMTLNYNIWSVSSGEEAVAYLKKHTVDLMVLDMIMDPGMDGLETYRNILAIHPKQKAIIVSGFSQSDRVHAAQSLGAGAYVRKPYIKETLGLAVRKELDKK